MVLLASKTKQFILRSVPQIAPDGWNDKKPPVSLQAHADPFTCKKARQRCSMIGNAVVPQAAFLALMSLSRNQISPNIIKYHTSIPRTLTDGHLTFKKNYSDTPLASYNLWYPVKLSKRSSSNVVTQLVYDTRNKSLLQRFKRKYGDNPYCIIACPEYIEWLCGFPRGWTDTQCRL